MGNIMPVGYRSDQNPRQVVCGVCGRVAAVTIEDLPHCSRCGGSYCRHCLSDHEATLRCGGDEGGGCLLDLVAKEDGA